jgi:hypothetical protein
MIETRQPRIETAREIVDGEIDAVSAEQRAFADFGARLADLEHTVRTTPGPTLAAGSGGLSTLARTDGASAGGLRQVRSAYRDTVMAVPHYEAEYDDSLAENVATEFGSELARCVATGNDLTPMTYEALVEETEQARLERARFLAALRRERASLRRIESALNDAERRAVAVADRVNGASTPETIDAVDEELRDLERRCDDLSTQRQETIHHRTVSNLSGIGDGSLSQYLYANRDSRFPALADVADCIETIQNLRQYCLR